MMSSITYKDAGVDIDAGNALVKKIAPMISATNRKGTLSQLGGFGGLFDLKAENYTDPILVSGTDGVGTKLKIAIDAQIHTTVGIDLVAMCANDVLVQGAQPLFFMDYFATSRLDIKIAQEVIQGIAEGCQQAGAALIGGETAEMPDFYPNAHYDLAGFCVGAVERSKLLPRQDTLKEGDIVLGLPSSGFHSNGFSLVRHVLQSSNYKFQDQCPWSSAQTISEALLTPTIIYVQSVMPLLDRDYVKAMAHITGGGLSENIPRILPDHLSCQIDLDQWELPCAFGWIKDQAQIASDEMLKTFNCGIGMVLIIDAENYDAVTALLNDISQPFFQIGLIKPKSTIGTSDVTYIGSLS